MAAKKRKPRKRGHCKALKDMKDFDSLPRAKRNALYRLAGAIYRKQYEGIPMAKKKAHGPKPRKGQKMGLKHARKIGGKFYSKTRAFGKIIMRPVKAASVKKAKK